MIDVKKEYEVALRGSSYSKIVVAKNVAEAKNVVKGYLKVKLPKQVIDVDRDLVARLLRVYKDDKLVGHYAKAKNVFEGRRG